MSRVRLCDDCGGVGARPFERGPAAERCPRCRGAGVLFADPRTAARDLRDLLTAAVAGDPALAALGPGGELRALSAAVAAVEERLDTLERELDRR